MMVVTEEQAEAELRRSGLTPERLGEAEWQRAVREAVDQLSGTTTRGQSQHPKSSGSMRKASELLGPLTEERAERIRERLAARRAAVIPPEPEVCRACDGAGAVRVTADPFHPLFGVAVPCDACTLGMTDEEKLRRAHLPGGYDHMTFDRFLSGANRVAARALMDWDGHQNLVLSGDFGRGKTHLAVAALRREVLERGRLGCFYLVPDLLEQIRKRYDADHPESAQRFTEGLARWDVLVLDDFGAERASTWALEQLSILLDRRIQSGLATLISTNLPDTDAVAEKYDGRIASRLGPRVYQWIRATGPDMRLYTVEDGDGGKA